VRTRDGGDLDQALGEGSENALFLSAQVADFRIHFQNSHSISIDYGFAMQ